ncbi:CYTH domain-containing protein [Parenemella sanctibonifatiensis]|uniref:CYTH domain-containing protein n=1 Tax=Parenemella sanctibonifatiensis TaxID=2016505 RepID=A0A255E379_9ACTN|nr:CYTH domain-containing protein [Parenemella sanctibonifatiensis]OYN83985.1 hypothetical protein CGZ92_13050 [Parenemella sanctibonifatiensis]
MEQLEIEDCWDLPDDTAVPDLSALGELSAEQTLTLEAQYFDTADLALLLQHHATLRRRTGGLDDGWHLKLPGGDSEEAKQRTQRRELHADLADELPAALAEALPSGVRAEDLEPSVRLSTVRRQRILATGVGTAELCTDTVTGSLGDRSVTWHELEVELVDGEVAVLEQVGVLLREAGLQPAPISSKVRRVVIELGLS